MGKKINSKNKGAEYERRIAKILGKWWNEDFHRTPMSGGLHWKEDNRVVGDIVTPPDSVFPFVIECKKREEWTLEQLLKDTGEMENWWDQVTSDGKGANLKPFLIFSKNFAPNYGMLRLSDFSCLVPSHKGTLFNSCILYKLGYEPRVIFLLDDFIQHVTKEHIIKEFHL